MILRILPSTLAEETIWAPPSKSIMQRIVAVATLAQGRTMIARPSESDDCTHALMMAAQLGAEVELGEDAIAIQGRFPLAPRSTNLTPGESGLGLRMFGVLASLHDSPLTLTRSGSLLSRHLRGFADALGEFGVHVKHAAPGQHPTVQGPLQGKEVHLDVSGSSQVLTGLLCALAHAQADSKLHLHGVVSRPYVQMTLEVLEDMAIKIEVLEENAQERTWTLRVPGNQRAQALDVAIDGDWSAAAFLLGLGALCAPHHLNVEGLHSSYTQADESIKGALLFGGCRLAGTEGGVQVLAGKPKSFQVDLTDSPDLFPPLAALAAFGKNPSFLRGIHRLGNKESNRGQAIQREWARVGIQVDLDQSKDIMTIHPGPIREGRMSSHGDHRMAMAAALLGAAGAPIEIEGAEAVSKSYPAFFDDLEALGVHIQVVAP